ncbi:uncharacterized protein LOC134681637 isoform X3 [Mytilus trossulus]|uniref:uncharacterized protein LOC134681637 isoform X3 n=1 Tax=Mytilus trossulus TaxID=6551 RepID=UPI003005A931
MGNFKRNIMYYRIRIGVIVFCLIMSDISCENNGTCKGGKCTKSLPIPLLDHLNAPLVANLDISQFNKQLQEYISDQIKQGVEEAKTDIYERMQEFVNMFEDNKVNESLVMINRIENINRDMNIMKNQQHQMETRTIEETERSGNLTSEIVAEMKQLGRQQQKFVTDVQQLKLYTESFISTKEEKDNFTAEVKDELKTLEFQLVDNQEDVQLLKTFQASVTSNIDLAVKRISINEQKVGFTACIGKGDGSTISAGQPIPFTLRRSSFNVDMSSVTSNGKFTITTKGLYLVSASIISKTNNGFFSINDGSYEIAYGYTAEHNGENTYDHSGTVVVVRYFIYGEIITVVPWQTMYIDAWSCMTVVRIK